MSFILLEWTFRDIDVEFLAFLTRFKTSVIRGRNSFMLVDSEQQLVKGSSINDMKSSGCSNYAL